MVCYTQESPSESGGRVMSECSGKEMLALKTWEIPHLLELNLRF